MVTNSRKIQNPPSKNFGNVRRRVGCDLCRVIVLSLVLSFYTIHHHTNLPGHFNINRNIMSFFRPVSDTRSELASSFNLESVYVRYMRRYILSCNSEKDKGCVFLDGCCFFSRIFQCFKQHGGDDSLGLNAGALQGFPFCFPDLNMC